jgi:hypothetical protein
MQFSSGVQSYLQPSGLAFFLFAKIMSTRVLGFKLLYTSEGTASTSSSSVHLESHEKIFFDLDFGCGIRSGSTSRSC